MSVEGLEDDAVGARFGIFESTAGDEDVLARVAGSELVVFGVGVEDGGSVPDDEVFAAQAGAPVKGVETVGRGGDPGRK